MIIVKDLLLWGTKNELLVDHFSFHCDEREKVVLTGPSGCGKSSVLRTLLGGFERWSGSVMINGIELSAKTAAAIRAQIAYVPQEPPLPEGTVEQFLAGMQKWKSHRYNSEIKKNQIKLIETFFDDALIIEKDTSILSGGERQRLALVAALSLQRPILLADEITSALDEQSRSRVLDYLLKMPISLISVSHDSIWIDRCNRSIPMSILGGSNG